MTQTQEAVFHQGDDQRRWDYTPAGTAMVNGEIREDNGIVYVCTHVEGIAVGELGACATKGVFRIKKDGVDTFSAGDKVAWDDTAKQAEPDGGANDDFSLGMCIKDAVATDDHVLVSINDEAIT